MGWCCYLTKKTRWGLWISNSGTKWKRSSSILRYSALWYPIWRHRWSLQNSQNRTENKRFRAAKAFEANFSNNQERHEIDSKDKNILILDKNKKSTLIFFLIDRVKCQPEKVSRFNCACRFDFLANEGWEKERRWKRGCIDGRKRCTRYSSGNWTAFSSPLFQQINVAVDHVIEQYRLRITIPLYSPFSS